jgi:UDP-2,3-diacylglucosamine pyrophosphatase LpxH
MTDQKLREWATPRQLEYLDAIDAHGSARKAAKALGVHKNVIQESYNRLKVRAASMGHSPQHDMTKTVPDGFKVKGVSTYYDQEGKARGQWVKSSIDQERHAELMRAAIEALSEEVKGMAPLTTAPAKTHDDLLAVYPLGDPHFGMYAWAKESGDDFDLKTARRLTLGAVDRLVSSSPAASTALILPLGDVFHANDQTNQTPAHKHQLDVDSRFVHVLQVGIETFRHCILRALEKHARVVVRFVAGNHDPQAVWALAFTIAAYFENEPRVEVDLSPARHWFYRFGKVMIGATHGDQSKAEQLLGVMACDRAEDWGQTKHRYWYCGHVHHSSVKEFPGVTVETFRTLAASDAYAAGNGYRAGRDMRAIIHHKDHGEVERHRCDVGMLEPA